MVGVQSCCHKPVSSDTHVNMRLSHALGQLKQNKHQMTSPTAGALELKKKNEFPCKQSHNPHMQMKNVSCMWLTKADCLASSTEDPSIHCHFSFGDTKQYHSVLLFLLFGHFHLSISTQSHRQNHPASSPL